jgi:GNAT superfamily N-acetyltransferase
VTIYTVGEIADSPKLLHQVVSLINFEYARKDLEFCAGLRFPRQADFLEQFGREALCAVIGVGERVVATATAGKWREIEGSSADQSFKRQRPKDIALVDAGQSYEVKGVATMEHPVTRGKGLAIRCISALEDAILASNGGSDVLLWLHTAEFQNGPYWQRRGFETVYTEEKPKGYWDAFEPFTFLTMVKRVKNTVKG